MWKTVVFSLSTVLVFNSATMITPSESKMYMHEREKLLAEEKSTFCGHQISLTAKEIQVNEIFLEEKSKELAAGYKASSDFLPALHFFHSKDKIDKSAAFALMRGIPKGSSLHTHLLAAVSVDFLIKNISYREHLYGGYVNEVFKLKFMANPEQDQRCNWTSVKKMRAEQGPAAFDEWLRKQLTLNVENPKEEYPDPESVWKKFKKTFTTTYDLFSYKPVFQEYIYQLLQELYEDNVMYTELKGTIMPLYELDGRTYSNEQFFEFFIEAVDNFKMNHPKFLGVRYIHSIYRGVDPEILQTGLEEIIHMKKLFSDFIAGFDFVGYEEEGKTLLDYSTQLLEAQRHLKFFFHAGETNWFGHTDLNLADAILLNSSRIGHGFAMIKHPKLLELGKKRNIPLEICPISNQVLMLNDDHRNHPAATLMALDYPVIVCNDDPSVWNASGLSYDWYMVFMAMTPKTSGLEVLKTLAMNSIIYSTMGMEEKNMAMKQWEKQWDVFLNNVLANYQNKTV